MAMLGYHPEMGEQKPAAEIEASLCHYGKHYRLTTPLVLSGRGVEHQCQLRAEQLTPKAQHKAGWHQYRVTLAAMERICAAHAVSYEMLL